MMAFWFLGGEGPEHDTGHLWGYMDGDDGFQTIPIPFGAGYNTVST